MNDKYIKMLITNCDKNNVDNEVPVSAILVKEDKIVAKANNSRIKNGNPLMHAEIKCILYACKKNEDWRLDNYDLYVTLEPCHMCKEIIKECRIRNVYYLLESTKRKNFKTKFNKVDSSYEEKYKKMLITFFKNLR